MRRALSALVLLSALAACTDSVQDPLAPAPLRPAPGAGEGTLATQPGPDEWIVVFRPGVADPPGLARRLVAQAGGVLRFTYQHTIRGFSATLPPQALGGVGNNPNVERIEPDAVVRLVTEEPAASWGLDRVDQAALPLSGTYVYETDGSGVDAYILDTGIRTTHSEFGGRAHRSSEADFIGGSGDDCNGHGTHVAGTVGGSTYGIARAVDLYAVRVLDCGGSGSLSGVIAGVDWVAGQRVSTGRPSVANMSLSAADPWGTYTALNDAVAAAVDAGVVFAVAASNDNDDACDYIPASEPKALTVGATSSTDARASFSNWGTCLDLFAPGVGIKSAHPSSDVATATWSGTSMASPHVAGVAALVLGEDPAADAASVAVTIVGGATTSVVTNAGAGSPDRLLYSLVAAGPGDPPDGPPADPENLTATAVSTSQVDLEWTYGGAGHDGFEVERSSDGTNYIPLASTGPAATGYSDTGLPAGATFHYRIYAFNEAGSSAPSNVATATTESEPEDVVATVMDVSEVDLQQTGKFVSGSVGVAVMDANSGLVPALLAGVTVEGGWYRDGDAAPFRTSSGVTDALGWVMFESGRVKTSGSLHFCVTDLSGEGFVDGTTYPACSPGFDPGDPDDPGDPGDPGAAPSNLVASYSSRAGGRVELSWSPGGGGEVDIYHVNAFLATSSDNGRYNHKGGAVGDAYQVCVAGAPAGDAARCSEVVTAG